MVTFETQLALMSPVAISNLYTMGVAAAADERQLLPECYRVPPPAVRMLRLKILIEEVLELAAALGVRMTTRQNVLMPGAINFIDTGITDLNDAIDACIDINYVSTGTLLGLGAPDLPHANEVNGANNRKFPEGKATVIDGKYQKPPGWQGPDHDAVRARIGDVNLRALAAYVVQVVGTRAGYLEPGQYTIAKEQPAESQGAATTVPFYPDTNTPINTPAEQTAEEQRLTGHPGPTPAPEPTTQRPPEPTSPDTGKIVARPPKGNMRTPRKGT